MNDEEALKVQRALLVDRTHWTLEYINEMDPLERDELMTLIGAVDAARAWKMRQK